MVTQTHRLRLICSINNGVKGRTPLWEPAVSGRLENMLASASVLGSGTSLFRRRKESESWNQPFSRRKWKLKCYLSGLMLSVLIPISDAVWRLNSKVAWNRDSPAKKQTIVESVNPNLEIFHVMLYRNFKAIEGGVQVVWGGHGVKHPNCWRPSDLDWRKKFSRISFRSDDTWYLVRINDTWYRSQDCSAQLIAATLTWGRQSGLDCQ